MAKHTPGPWFATKDSAHNDVCRIGRAWIIASPLALSHFGHVDADATVIAAAPDLLDAAECAARVLFLLEREVSALGFRAGNVRERLSAAIAKAGGDDGRWNERLAEARSDLCDAINELEQP